MSIQESILLSVAYEGTSMANVGTPGNAASQDSNVNTSTGVQTAMHDENDTFTAGANEELISSLAVVSRGVGSSPPTLKGCLYTKVADEPVVLVAQSTNTWTVVGVGSGASEDATFTYDNALLTEGVEYWLGVANTNVTSDSLRFGINPNAPGNVNRRNRDEALPNPFNLSGTDDIVTGLSTYIINGITGPASIINPETPNFLEAPLFTFTSV